FLASGKLIIQVGKPTNDERIISCGTDETAAARLLVGHLVELGHTTFGIVADATAVSRLRAQALKQALQERGLLAPPLYSYLSDYESVAAGTDAAAYFSQDRNRANWPTAIIATGDLIALSFIRRIEEDGVSVPGFVSVASYNDI